jgi:hypothetical protein
MLKERRRLWFSLSFSLTCLTKFQPVIIAPFVLLYVLWDPEHPPTAQGGIYDRARNRSDEIAASLQIKRAPSVRVVYQMFQGTKVPWHNGTFCSPSAFCC